MSPVQRAKAFFQKAFVNRKSNRAQSTTSTRNNRARSNSSANRSYVRSKHAVVQTRSSRSDFSSQLGRTSISNFSCPPVAGSVDIDLQGIQAQNPDKMFGVSLKICPRRRGLPHVLMDSIEIIRRKGLKTPGLFRVPGASDQVAYLKQLYDDSDKKRARTELENSDVHVVASVMKMFLRELPKPIISESSYQKALERKNHSHLRRILSSKTLIEILCIRFLLRFLREVASFKEHNRMDSRNLAICLTPNILRMGDGERLKTGSIQDEIESRISFVNGLIDATEIPKTLDEASTAGLFQDLYQEGDKLEQAFEILAHPSLQMVAHTISAQRRKMQLKITSKVAWALLYCLSTKRHSDDQSVFTGTKAVDFMIENGLSHTREAAIELGNVMIRRGLIEHVSGIYQELQDSHILYRILYGGGIPENESICSEILPSKSSNFHQRANLPRGNRTISVPQQIQFASSRRRGHSRNSSNTSTTSAQAGIIPNKEAPGIIPNKGAPRPLEVERETVDKITTIPFSPPEKDSTITRDDSSTSVSTITNNRTTGVRTDKKINLEDLFVDQVSPTYRNKHGANTISNIYDATATLPGSLEENDTEQDAARTIVLDILDSVCDPRLLGEGNHRFIGRVGVNFLLQKGYAVDREQAISIFDELMDEGLIGEGGSLDDLMPSFKCGPQMVTEKKHGFHDTYVLYRVLLPDEPFSGLSNNKSNNVSAPARKHSDCSDSVFGNNRTSDKSDSPSISKRLRQQSKSSLRTLQHSRHMSVQSDVPALETMKFMNAAGEPGLNSLSPRAKSSRISPKNSEARNQFNLGNTKIDLENRKKHIEREIVASFTQNENEVEHEDDSSSVSDNSTESSEEEENFPKFGVLSSPIDSRGSPGSPESTKFPGLPLPVDNTQANSLNNLAVVTVQSEFRSLLEEIKEREQKSISLAGRHNDLLGKFRILELEVNSERDKCEKLRIQLEETKVGLEKDRNITRRLEAEIESLMLEIKSAENFNNVQVVS